MTRAMTPGLARASSIGGANMLSTTLAMWRPGGEAEGRPASRPSRRPRTSLPVRSTSHHSSTGDVPAAAPHLPVL